MNDKIAKPAYQFVRWDDMSLQDQATVVQQLVRELAVARGLSSVSSHPFVRVEGPAGILETEFDNALIDAAPERFALYVKKVYVDSDGNSSIILVWPEDKPKAEGPGTLEA